MPELPELEVFAANLESHFKDKVLQRIEVTVAKKLSGYRQDFQQHLESHRLHNIIRDGQTLLMQFRRGRSLALHLMLQGEIELITANGKAENRIIALYFDNGKGFALNDAKKQATATMNPQPAAIPDVFSKDFTPAYFETKLENEGSTIKRLLTGQQVVRGIGNSYADETLWQAGISPFSIAQAIPKHKIQQLYQLMLDRLKADIQQFKAIANGGFTGNIGSLYKIHNTGNVFSPTGGKILVDTNGPNITYYTDEQELFKL